MNSITSGLRNFLFASILTTAAFSLTACGGDSGSDGGDGSDTTQVVKVEPQDFPVNKLPESQFNKTIEKSVDEGLEPATGALATSPGKFPDWLEAIISRESIVIFASKVLEAMPEEVEFVQAGQTHLDGGTGWKAFTVTFNTRPSNATILVYGAYENEENSYWASDYSAGAAGMRINGLEAMDGGVKMMGSAYFGGEENAANFSAELTKETVKWVSGGAAGS